MTATATHLLRAREVAEALDVSEDTVRRLSRRGAVPVVRIGRANRYDLAAVVAALNTKNYTEEVR